MSVDKGLRKNKRLKRTLKRWRQCPFLEKADFAKFCNDFVRPPKKKLKF